MKRNSGAIGVLTGLAALMAGALVVWFLYDRGFLTPNLSNAVGQKTQPITLTASTLEKSNFRGPFLTVVQQGTGTFYYAKILSAKIADDLFSGESEVEYPSGERGLFAENPGNLVFDFKTRSGTSVSAALYVRGVAGITLPDGSVLPVKIITGRISEGHLVGDFKLISLKEAMEITGNFDMRGKLSDLSIYPSVRVADPTADFVVREIMRLYQEDTGGSPGKVLAATDPPAMLSGLTLPSGSAGTLVQVARNSETGTVTVESVGVPVTAPVVATLPTITGDVSVDATTGVSTIGSGVVTGSNIANGTISDSDIADDASIGDRKLARITASDKIAGSAIELKSGGGLVNSTGLTLTTSCTTGQVLEWNGGSWICATPTSSSAGVSLLNSLSGSLSIAGSGINTISVLGSTITVNATEADNLSSVTGRGTTTTNLLDLSGGLTVSGGSVTFPAGEIGNSELTNSSFNLAGGSGSGSVNLGDTLTFSGSGGTTTSVSGNTVTINTPTAGSLTVKETDGTPTVNPATTLEFGPSSSSSDEFSITDIGGGTARIRTGSQVPLLNQSSQVTGGWIFNTNPTSFTSSVALNGGLTSNSDTTWDLTGVSSRTLSILNSTVGQVANLNLSDGGLYASGVSRLTNSGALENINGVTLTLGNIYTSPGTNLDLESGTTGNIDIGTDSFSEHVYLGNGLASKDVVLGSYTGSSTTTINGGTSGILIGDRSVNKQINIGGNIFDAVDVVRIATNAGSGAGDTITIGNNNASTTMAVTGGPSWSVDTSGNVSGRSLKLSTISNQIELGTTNTTTISALAPSGPRVASIPALTADDTFVFNDQSAILTNKTISGTANTISNIGNASLTNSSITINTSGILSGGGTVSLGGNLTLTGTETDNFYSVTARGATSSANIVLSSTAPLTLSNTNPVLTLGATDANGVLTITDSSGTPHNLLTLTDVGTVGNLNVSGTVSGSNLSGTNTGDQTISLTSDVTGSGTGSFATTIANGAVTLSKMANLAANSIIGNNTGSPGTPLALSVSDVKSLLAISTADISGLGTIATQSAGNVFITGGAMSGITIGGTASGLTISGLSNTLSNIGNTSLSNSSLTVSAGDGLTGGGSVSLGGTTTLSVNTTTSGTSLNTSSNSGMENSASGIALLRGCSDTQVLKWNSGTSTWSCASDTSGGSPSLNTITAAAGSNSIANGDYAQTWNWTLTTASKTAFNFGESSASTNGVGSQYLLGISTLASSTANPFFVSAQGNKIIDTTSAGNITLGSGTTTLAVSSNGGLNVTTGGALTGVASIDTIGVNSTSLSFAGAGSVASNTTNAITIDSGTTGGVNLGTGANAKTITIGNSTLATAVNIITGTGGITLGDNANTKTINIGDVSNSGADTINIATNSTAADAISVGNSNAATTMSLASGNWYVTATGSANFQKVQGAGLSDCTGSNQKLQWNAATNQFSCTNESTLQTRSFTDTTVVTWTDTTTTELYTTSPRPNITPTSSSNAVLVMVSAAMNNPGNNNQVPVGRITKAVGGTANCTTSGEVDSRYGYWSTDTSSRNVQTSIFLDSVATTSNVSYTLCTSTDSILAATPTQKTSSTVTLIEVSNSTADLAELYSTNDKTLTPGDVVSLDSMLKSGVKKSISAYDPAVLGIVSTAPALTIGGTDGEGISAVPVALSGRVPVKVSAAGGSIKAGDLLTTSHVPGIAMKATKAGSIIGTAMNDFSGDGVGIVIAFVKNGTTNGTKIADILENLTNTNDANVSSGEQILSQLIRTAQSDEYQTITSSEVTTDFLTATKEIVTPKLTVDTVVVKKFANSLGMMFMDVAEFFGKVIFHSNVSIFGHLALGNDSAGHAFLKAGSSEVVVVFKETYLNTPSVLANINLSGAVPFDQIPKYAIYDLTVKGFKIKLDRPANFDVDFSWTAVETMGGTVSVPVAPVETPQMTPTVESTPLPSSTPIETSLPISTMTPQATPGATESGTVVATPAPTTIPTAVPEQTASPTPTT